MADLLAGNTPSGAAGAGRAQNGSSRPGAGSTAAGQPRLRTPTVVMAERRAREARRAEQEAAQKSRQEDESRRQAENVVGVGDDRRQTSGRTPLTEIQPGVAPGTTGVTITRRRNENIPTTNGAAPRTGVSANPTQPRPVSAQQQAATDPSSIGQINKNRTEAFEKLSMPAVAGPKTTQPPNTSYTAPPPSDQPRERVAFPHAFERWETLSSHWEGLTSYWIRRLESNTEELSGKPIDQQMARQITDLSAAGANLFHAVVELQRLRASSERKFQRWFFETRNDQEQARERIAELERQLHHERENGSTNNTAVEAVQAEKAKSDELVREMKRELQISKEEARRAWEELGRREQEERERTIALRSGEPTMLGGVQVVPMAGMTSRQFTSSSRPQTRGGPVAGSAGPTQMSGQQQPQQREAFSRSQTTLESPEREQEQFTYQPGQTSPTETDPFTETSWANEPPQPLRHEPDTQFYPSPPRSQAQAGMASATATAAARTTASPSRGHTQSTSPSRFYQGTATSTSLYQPLVTTAPAQRPLTAGSDARSYIPSVNSGSEEEYHINPDGTYTRDDQGRRIPRNQPIMQPSVEDDEDYTDDVERERMYAQQYSQRQAGASQIPRTNGGSVPTTTSSAHHTTTMPISQSQTPPGSRSYSSNISATAQPVPQPSTADYEGTGYSSAGEHGEEEEDDDVPSNIVTGWEGIHATPRHQHPSRLSAIIEERSSRTSPSRTSYASESNPTNQRGFYSGNGSLGQQR